MNDELVLYMSPMSRGRIVHWMLEELGIPYRVELVNLCWMFFAAVCIDSAMIDRMLARPVPERTGAIGYGRHEHVFDTLEKSLSPGPYLLGQAFTAADLYVSSQLGFGLAMKALEPRPAFRSYLDLIEQRPAYLRANQKSAALIERMKGAS